MSFTDTQIASLKAKLSRSRVAQRKQGNGSVSYVEGWHCIAEANRIFGFDAWDRETVDLRQLGEPRNVDGKTRVAYSARVRITVRANGVTIAREGSGFGSGIDRDLGQAHESALKEAETDAMKRALMTFGNPFGLALYDKTRANVGDDPPAESGAVDPDDAAHEYIATCKKRIADAPDTATLASWWNTDDRKQAFRDFELNEAECRELQQLVTARVEALKPRAVG